jgi:hypothetical protein
VDRQTRDKFATRTTPKNWGWETPPAVYQKLDHDFGPFDVDLTADQGNHLCPVWLGPGSPYHEDALTASWWEYGDNGYSNPVYGKFAEKMLLAADIAKGLEFRTTLFLPLRITRAFKKHVLQGAQELLFCDKRIVFREHGAPRFSRDKTGKMRPDTALFDSIVVRYYPGGAGRELKVGVWEVPPHVWTDEWRQES